MVSCSGVVGLSSSEERLASSSHESATGCWVGFFGFAVEEVVFVRPAAVVVGRGISWTGPFSPMERPRSEDRSSARGSDMARENGEVGNVEAMVFYEAAGGDIGHI